MIWTGAADFNEWSRGRSEASVNISKSEQLSSVVDILYFCVNTGGASQ